MTENERFNELNKGGCNFQFTTKDTGEFMIEFKIPNRAPKRLYEVVDMLRATTNHAEFREILEREVIDFYRNPGEQAVIADPKFVADIAGLLFSAIHGSTDVGE